MSDVADWLIKKGYTTNDAALEAAINAGYVGSAAYILLVDPPDVFGESGLIWRFRQQGTTIAGLAAMEQGWAAVPGMRDELLQKASDLLLERETLDLSDEVLTTISRADLMDSFRNDYGISEAALFPLDEEYSMVNLDTLRRIAPYLTSLRLYYQFKARKADCDNAAAVQLGRKALLNPGNVALGFAAYSANIGGHAVSVARCPEGAFIIENEGSVVPFGDYWNVRNLTVQRLII